MIRQREFLRRNRRRVTLLAVLAALGLALVAEHSGLENPHMDDGMAHAVSMCLAVLGGGALGIGAAALARACPRPRPEAGLVPLALVSLAVPATAPSPARGSPPLLQVFRR